jgi:hypothetical protein
VKDAKSLNSTNAYAAAYMQNYCSAHSRVKAERDYSDYSILELKESNKIPKLPKHILLYLVNDLSYTNEIMRALHSEFLTVFEHVVLVPQ